MVIMDTDTKSEVKENDPTNNRSWVATYDSHFGVPISNWNTRAGGPVTELPDGVTDEKPIISVIDLYNELAVDGKDELDSKEIKFFEILDKEFKDVPEVRQKLGDMYADYGIILKSSPASSKIHYHNCYLGGYIDHVINVYENALRLTQVMKKSIGECMLTYSRKELVMAALHHDLWKLGDPSIRESYYVYQTSDWHRIKMQSLFMHNPRLPEMTVPDGSLYILQLYNISLSYNTWISIKLSDGMYDNSNHAYYKSFAKYPMHSNLPYIIHWADHLSSVAERSPLVDMFLNELQLTGKSPTRIAMI